MNPFEVLVLGFEFYLLPQYRLETGYFSFGNILIFSVVQPNLQKSDTVITTVLVAPLVLILLDLWALLRLEERVNELHALEWLR